MTYAMPDFEPMFDDNITWKNDTIKGIAEARCGDKNECLFDVASTNDLSVGIVTKEIGIQMLNESRTLGMAFPYSPVTYNKNLSALFRASSN